MLGIDLHPVAGTLARVTYLLAIGRERLTNAARGTIQVPVYLGNSIQWQEQQLDLWTAGNLVIHADDKKELFSAELRFRTACLRMLLFDQLVNELADRASSKKKGAAVPSLTSVYQRLAIPQEAHSTIDATFQTMCRLHDEGRDHIWGYYVRNLARPMWLAREENRVDVLIGNPPWLAYRHMTAEMQKVFRNMSEARGLWAGADVATHQDLSALFVVRASELYLKKGGKFAMVMPNAAVTDVHYEGFRRGHYENARRSISHLPDSSGSAPYPAAFFPRGASVVFGGRGDRPRHCRIRRSIGRVRSVGWGHHGTSPRVSWRAKRMPCIGLIGARSLTTTRRSRKVRRSCRAWLSLSRNRNLRLLGCPPGVWRSCRRVAQTKRHLGVACAAWPVSWRASLCGRCCLVKACCPIAPAWIFWLSSPVMRASC